MIFKKFRKLKCNDIKKMNLCKATESLVPILEYAQNLDFKEEPDYTKFKHLLNMACLEIDQEPVKYFNWPKRVNNRFQDIKESFNQINGQCFESLEFDDVEEYVIPNESSVQL